MAKSKGKGIEFEVQKFKALNLNNEFDHASMGVNVDHPGAARLSAVHDAVTGAQLDFVIRARAKGAHEDDAKQEQLIDTEAVVEGQCRCVGFSDRMGKLLLNLKFTKSEIDRDALDGIGGLAGTLAVVRVGNAKLQKGDTDGNE